MQRPLNTVTQLLALMQPFVDDEHLLKRSSKQLQDGLDEFIMIKRNDVIVGCVALKHYAECQTGEIYALVVSKDYHNTGVSAELMILLLKKAKNLGLSTLFALSKYGGHFFVRNGFEVVSVDDLPKHRQASYDYQRSSTVYLKHC